MFRAVSRLLEIVRVLAAIDGRGACTDAERRACAEVRDEIRGRGRPARMEPYWGRPQWAAAWAAPRWGAWRAARAVLGAAASLVSVSAPAVALGIALATLVSYALDLTGR